jgi:hypothetical protein
LISHSNVGRSSWERFYDGERESGSGTGTGLCSEGGVSHIDNITISNSSILEALSHAGSGIGTGGAWGRGSRSSIGVLVISGPHINLSSS